MGGWAVPPPLCPSAHPPISREGPHSSIQSPGQPTGFLTGLIELTPFRGLDQVEILHQLKDVRKLSKGSNCDVEKAAKLPWTFLCRSFDNVRRHRESSSSGLGCEAVTFLDGEALGYTIRGEDQQVSGLPGLEAFIALHDRMISKPIKRASTASVGRWAGGLMGGLSCSGKVVAHPPIGPSAPRYFVAVISCAGNTSTRVPPLPPLPPAPKVIMEPCPATP